MEGGKKEEEPPRQIFYIELNPEETTIVSWKKLLRDAEAAKKANQPAPSQPAADVAEGGPAVDVVKQNQESQFVMDELFKGDKATTKHNRPCLNKGKLENLNESMSSADGQSNKRRKNMQNAPEEKNNDQISNKHAKLGQTSMSMVTKSMLSKEQISSNCWSLPANSDHNYDGKSSHTLSSPVELSEKRVDDLDDSIFLTKPDGSGKQVTGVLQSTDLGKKLKDATEISGATHQKYQDHNASNQHAPRSKRNMSETIDEKFSPQVCPGNKSKRHKLPDLNLPHYPMPQKLVSVLPDDVCRSQPNDTTIKRAIKALEKAVAESKRQDMIAQGANTSSIATKKRFPTEVKLKLTKVATLVSSQGEMSEELTNRIMNILWDLVQLRTLKASKQNDKVVKDFEAAVVHEEKGFNIKTYSSDDAFEHKIYDLYNQYIQGMVEDKGSQIRELYAELAELGIDGAGDNDGIKNRIYIAKDQVQGREKIGRKKSSTPGTGDSPWGKANSTAYFPVMEDKLETKYKGHISATSARPSMKDSAVDFSEETTIENVSLATFKEQIKQQGQELEKSVKKLSLGSDKKEARKTHQQDV